MKKNIFFEVPILNFEYKVYVCVSDKKYARKKISFFLDEEINIDRFDGVMGVCFFRKSYNPCIWVDNSLKKNDFIGSLSHESVHAVIQIMTFIGMNAHEGGTDEFLAHSVGAIMRKVLNKVYG